MIFDDACKSNYRLPPHHHQPPPHDEPPQPNQLHHLLGATLLVWIDLLIIINAAAFRPTPLLLEYQSLADACKSSSIRDNSLVSKPNKTAHGNILLI